MVRCYRGLLAPPGPQASVGRGDTYHCGPPAADTMLASSAGRSCPVRRPYPLFIVMHRPSGRRARPWLASAIVALAQPCTYWINGNVINVDGGEAASG